MGDEYIFYRHWYDISVHFVQLKLFNEDDYVYPNLKTIHMIKCVWCPRAHCSECLELQEKIVVKPWRFPRLTAIYFPGSVTPWKFKQEFQSRLIIENQTTLSRLLQHNRNKLKTAVVAFLSIRRAYKYIDANVVKMICNLFFTSSPLSWGYTYSEFDYSRKKKIKP